MSFASPALLLLLVLVPLGVLAARSIEARRRARAVALLGSGSMGSGGGSGASGRFASRGRVRAVLPGAMLVAGFVVLTIAIARPQAKVALPRPEGTVMLTFDVSGSMAATDLTPTRLDTARSIASTIVQQQPPGVVVGLVAFSDAGIAVHAPTSDQADILAAIDRLVPARGTSVGQGLISALDAIAKAQADTPAEVYSNRSQAPTETRAPVDPASDAATVIVLLSDGENNERPDPIQTAQEAADRGIRIVTIGVGSAAGADLDLDGFRVHTQLDEATLTQIADMTGGSYHRADAQDSIDAIYQDLQPRLVVRSEPLEVTALFAALGLTLVVVGGALSLAWAGRLP
jgi:Ca-activated chloride channel family protein